MLRLFAPLRLKLGQVAHEILVCSSLSLQPNARLIGIEYIISRPLFEALPGDEKKCVERISSTPLHAYTPYCGDRYKRLWSHAAPSHD